MQVQYFSRKKEFEYDLDNIRTFSEGWGEIEKVEAYGVSFGTVYLISVQIVDKAQYNKLKLLQNHVHEYFEKQRKKTERFKSLYRTTFVHKVAKDQYDLPRHVQVSYHVSDVGFSTKLA